MIKQSDRYIKFPNSEIVFKESDAVEVEPKFVLAEHCFGAMELRDHGQASEWDTYLDQMIPEAKQTLHNLSRGICSVDEKWGKSLSDYEGDALSFDDFFDDQRWELLGDGEWFIQEHQGGRKGSEYELIFRRVFSLDHWESKAEEVFSPHISSSNYLVKEPNPFR